MLNRAALLLGVWLAAGVSGCREAGGVAAVSRALAGRYGERSFELAVDRVNGDRTTVEISLNRLPADGREFDRAQEIAGIVREAYPLEGERDSVVVRLTFEEDRRGLQTRRVETFRFAAREVGAGR